MHSRLLSLVQNFSEHSYSVLVVGDVMLDRYLTGEVHRVSPEAPVPVLLLKHTDERLGGAGNVAANLRGLGMRTHLLGLVGDDAHGKILRDKLLDIGVNVDGLCVSASRMTTTKTRIASGNQQIVRVDEENITAMYEADNQQILQAFRQALVHKPDVVVLSDYAKGVLNPANCQAIISACRQLGICVLADPKGPNYHKYRGATALTPNKKEIAEACGADLHDMPALLRHAEAFSQTLELDFLAVTRGEDGVSLLQGGEVNHIPATAQAVFDVSGAGDTVIATLATGLAHGLTPHEALQLANISAGVVVGIVGTAPISMALLLATLQNEGLLAESIQADKCMPLSALQKILPTWAGQTIVFTNGCFDVLHAGHVMYLEKARAEGDKLIVGLNSDRSLRALKGETRPIHTEADRARVLSALSVVSAVVVFDSDTPLALIEAIRPQVLVKGDDYTEEQIVGAAQVKSWGGRVVRVPLLKGLSTTQILKKLSGT